MSKWLSVLLLLTLPVMGEAANRYVRAGASGTGTGVDWTNAYTTLPATLTRGDTYYIADGIYASYTFDDDASGAATITIKKATASDHGTEAGWSAAYGDGQATFGELHFTRPYYVIDGVVRNESDWKDYASYGIETTAVRASRLDGGHIGSDCSADDLTFRYLHVGADTTSFATRIDGRSFYIGGFGGGSVACERWTISHVLTQNIYEVQCAGGEDLTIEYSHFYIGWSKETIRGQVWCKNVIVRYNIFEDSCQRDPEEAGTGCTGEIAAWDGPATGMDQWQVYGNVFFKTTTENNSGGVVIVGDTNVGPPTNNSVAYNNTFYGFADFASGPNLILLNGGSGNVARNNLAYAIAGAAAFSANTTSNNIEVTSDPFVSAATGNFRLSAATSLGYTLPSPYNIDLLGATRGAIGVWDLGAYEFPSGDVVAPSAPTNVRIR